MFKPFEYGEHTADILVIARGLTLAEAFANAALGVLNIMYDTSRVEGRESYEVSVEGMDLEQLLFNWIDEIIYWFDGRKFAIGSIDVTQLDEGRAYMRAVLRGEKYSIDKHGFRGTIVKAVTYNMMEIRREDSVYRVQFVVDI